MDERVMLLSGVPEMVDIAPRYDEMEPIAVREASGAGVLSCVRVSSLFGLGACTMKSDGCWQLRKPSRLKQQFHWSFVVS